VQQLISVWSRLDMRGRIIVAGATAAMFFAIIAMSNAMSKPSMSLLYAGLESKAAGDVVAAIEQSGVAFDVRGGSIFVDSEMRDQLRLTLASEGMPSNTGNGYELLDNLTGFGTTSQMFDAAYWRAKEGELARTIVASPHISNARVHIANAGSNPFQRTVTPKASVAVSMTGGTASGAQAKAIRYLVASAVAGLRPEDVAVIDANGVLIGQAEDTQPALQGHDKAQALKERVERLLEARVGLGNAIVEVSVDTETNTEAIRERTFDPQGRVAISTDTEERTNSSSGGAGGDVTVASNLPDRDGAEGGGGNSAQNSETRERINYEISETEREIVKAAGAIKRITVAVLVNEATEQNDQGEVISTPRSEEELTADRFGIDVMSLLQMAVLAIVAIFLGLFVVKPLLTQNNSREGASDVLALPSDAPSTGTPEPVLTGDIASDDMDFPDLAMGGFDGPPGTLPELPMMGGGPEDPVDRLRSMIGERQEETVEILRTWLEEKEEAA